MGQRVQADTRTGSRHAVLRMTTAHPQSCRDAGPGGHAPGAQSTRGTHGPCKHSSWVLISGQRGSCCRPLGSIF